jgi:type II secretory pathway component PulF
MNNFNYLSDWFIKKTPASLTRKIFFTKNLRTLIKIGLSVPEALNTIGLQTSSNSFRKTIFSIKREIESGHTLSFGLSKFPKSFPVFYRDMIEIGEKSNTLERALIELTEQLKKDYRLRAKIRRAIIYPLIALITTLSITIGLMVLTLLGCSHSATAAYENSLPLPLATSILTGDGNFVHLLPSLLIIVVLIIAIIGINYFIDERSKKYLFHYVFSRNQVIRPVIEKINLARYTRTIVSLLRLNIPIARALKIASKNNDSFHYEKAILASPAQQRIEFPPLVMQLLTASEQSNDPEELLSAAAKFYEQQANNVLDNLSLIIESALILSLICLISGVALIIIASGAH